MSYIDFMPFSIDAVKVSFACSNCGERVKSELITVPIPDYSAENDSESQRDNEDYAVCNNCESEYCITVFASMYGGMIDVSGDKEVSIETINVVETPKEYDLDYQEPNNVFRLEKLYIENFKNLKQQTFDFTNHNGLTLLIGNNSSGKSNLIEAICGVFYSLYEKYEWRKQRCKAIPNKFEVEYTCGTFKNKIKVDTTSYQAYNNLLSYDNSIATPDLPSRVVAIYSGEEDRLKQHYFDPFLKKYKQGSQLKMPSMLFLNKDHWDIALLCLLYSDRKNDTSFVSELLGDIIVSDVRINFNASNIVSLERYNNLLIYHLKTHTNEHGLMPIEDIVSIIDYDVVELFQSLYIAKTQTKATIRSIDFNFTQEDDNEPAFNCRGTGSLAIYKYCLQSLSEGQKKLILITAAMEFAGQENSLFLLDEPDAHVHLSNKHKIIDVVKKYAHNRHIIITTHSPTLCKYTPSESILMISNGASENVGTQIDAAKKLVGENKGIDIFFSTSPIVLVEGAGDIKYIKRSIELLSDENELYKKIDWFIIPMGGAANAEYFIEEFITFAGSDRKIIVIFDRDEAGATALKKQGIKGGRNNINTYSKDNLYFLMLPKKIDHEHTDFVIEDYFTKEHKKRIAKEKLDCVSGCFNELPKDLKEITKEQLKKDLNNHTKDDMAGFSTLIDKILSIINESEAVTKL